MILTAHQPVYLPWLGLFEKISRADVFCWLDDVQYEKNGFNNRNKILGANGPHWLTVPVAAKNHFDLKLKDVVIIEDGWRRKHLRGIEHAYQKAPFFEQYYAGLGEIIGNTELQMLADLNLAILQFGLGVCDIKAKILKASDYGFSGRKSELVLEICRELHADFFIFGANGRDYADVQSFANAGIGVEFQAFQHPVYTQLHQGFTPNMTFVDALFNVGPNLKDLVRVVGPHPRP